MKLFLIIPIAVLFLLSPASGQKGYAEQEKSQKAAPEQPKSDKTAASRAESTLSGKVIETMDSGGYTYVKLESSGKNIWVAVPKMKLKKGQQVSFRPGAEMTNFESKTLKRKFESIIFSAGPADDKAGKENMTPPGSKESVVISKEKINVDKAKGPNAHTVAEIYKNKDTLDKKEVVVSGKVLKVSEGIMNKNWIHIQDGTGDTATNTQDLVVTSQDLPSVGDIVTVTGTLSKDKDFGSGYKYSLIIENASIKK